MLGSEIKIQIEAKICGCNTKHKNISYHFAESDHTTYFEKTEIILAQIQACEILLKDTKDDTVASVIQSEIVDLTLVLAGTILHTGAKIRQLLYALSVLISTHADTNTPTCTIIPWMNSKFWYDHTICDYPKLNYNHNSKIGKRIK